MAKDLILGPCDGCGRELETGPREGLTFCGECEAVREGDPEITLAGRRLLLSEARRQVEADEADPDVVAQVAAYDADHPAPKKGRK